LAWLLEFFDDSVRSYEDLTEFVKLPVLSVIPHIAEASDDSPRANDLICESHPKSSASESFRSLRTSLTLSAPTEGSLAYLITSAVPSEGKTTVAVNVAIVMAHSGRKVVLVDADLRRFGIHKPFGLGNDVGLTDNLTGHRELSELVRSSDVQGLSVLTSGPSVENPVELLDSKKMAETVMELKERYDVVIIDSPPLTAVADPLILARQVDGVLQVVHGNKTSRKAVKRAKELLESVKAPLLGAILNNIDFSRDGYHYGYYRTGYYHD
jgi:capsular exopolysaccharide synthesis family protein